MADTKKWRKSLKDDPKVMAGAKAIDKSIKDNKASSKAMAKKEDEKFTPEDAKRIKDKTV